ncbi:MAG TPA: hypothetical protein VOA41_05505 [Candidatus Dormibacteraeota bacterium]|nr:hypothetical protein [Candidatus Dormibacteraeota bacterium]
MTEAAPLPTKQRADHRVTVHLPMWVRGRDCDGMQFEESTASENLCRSGAAFVTRHRIDLGADLEITIPLARPGNTAEKDFATRGRVIHVVPVEGRRQRIVGVQFTGRRFQRIFRPETSA